MSSRHTQLLPGLIKDWDPEFTRTEKLERVIPHFEIPEAFDTCDGDDDDEVLERLWKAYASRIPSLDIEVLEDFCHETSLASLQVGEHTATYSVQKSWLDDREAFTEKSREYPDKMSVRQLYEALKQPRFGAKNLTDADRRLIYINDLDPYYIRVLVETMPNQYDLLQDIFSKHLLMQTVLSVDISTDRLRVWTLGFHVPYLALRKVVMEPSNRNDSGVHGRLAQEWTDLSCLGIQPRYPEKGCTYGVHKAHFSFGSGGPSDHRSTGIAISYAHFNESGDEEESGGEGSFVDEEEEDDEHGSIRIDPILSDDDLGAQFDANETTANPRAYFIFVIDSRMQIVLKEWEYLVGKVQFSVRQRQGHYKATVLHKARNDQAACIRSAVIWLMEVVDMLSGFSETLETTLDAWYNFAERENGDIGYFSDIIAKVEDVSIRIDRIKKVYRKLSTLHRQLNNLCISCEKLRHTIELSLKLTDNVLTMQSHQLISTTNDLNRLNLAQSEEAVKVNREVNAISAKNHEVSQLTFSMSQVAIPLSLVVAFFGTQKEIFSFPRNALSFILSIVFANLSYFMIVNIIRRPSWLKNTFISIKQLISGGGKASDLETHDMDTLSGLPK